MKLHASRNSSAWVTWERQQRNLSMSKLFSADYYELSEPRSNYFFRVVCNIVETFKIFKKEYSVVFVQNPSFVLAGVAIIFKKIFKSKLVVDAHNAGVYPLEGRVPILLTLNNFFLRKSDLVIVSNESLRCHLEQLGIKSAAMPDPIPNIPSPTGSSGTASSFDVFIICSWSDDEPVDLYLSVAKQFPHLSFGISGNFKRKIKAGHSEIPGNFSLLGYVSEEKYFSILTSSKVVVDLTTRENCLVCGAYEAISASIPAILSDSEVNRDVFRQGVVFSKCNIDSLAKSIEFALLNHSTLKSGTKKTKEKLEKDQLRNMTQILEMINA